MANLSSAAALTLRSVRCVFNTALADTTTGANGAGNPSNWTIQASLDGVNPIVPVVVSTVTVESTTSFVLGLADDATPSGSYAAVASTNITGVAAYPNNSAGFTGVVPSVPAGRDFSVVGMLPSANFQADDSGDLVRLAGVLQEPLTLLMDSIDRWPEILDIDQAPADFLDLMLRDLGDPFEIALSTLDKRRLLRVLVGIYKQKGTLIGIKNALRLFVGYEVDIVSKYRGTEGWILGTSALDVDAALGGAATFSATLSGSDLATLTTAYEFLIKVGKPNAAALTADESSKVTEVVTYMKPAHTQALSVSSVLPPPITVTATPGVGQISIAWSAVAGATDYVVLWDVVPTVNANSPYGIVDAASPYVDTVVSGITKYYIVCARTAGGINGVPSARVKATAL